MQIEEKTLQQIAETLTEANLSIQLLVQGHLRMAEVDRTLSMIHLARKQLLAARKGVKLEG